jgi:hypothetical protein
VRYWHLLNLYAFIAYYLALGTCFVKEGLVVIDGMLWFWVAGIRGRLQNFVMEFYFLNKFEKVTRAQIEWVVRSDYKECENQRLKD